MSQVPVSCVVIASVLCTLSVVVVVESSNTRLSKTVDHDVFGRNLVSENITGEEILANHETFCRVTSRVNFNSTVLGYVTPWNNLGYDVAKRFGKFGIISPVWLQLRPDKSGQGYHVTGTHDIDKSWMADVRRANKANNVKIVPRVLFEDFSGQHYSMLFDPTSRHMMHSLGKTLAKTLKEYGFDGAVLELWSQVAPSLGQQRHYLHTLVLQIAAQLKKRALVTILVIPPAVDSSGNPGVFLAEDFSALRADIDYFSLMTYDYSSPIRPGPNSPIGWVERCVSLLTDTVAHRTQILLGLNFYGYHYTSQGGGAIVGSQWLDLLREAHSDAAGAGGDAAAAAGGGVEIMWDDSSAEHLALVTTLHKHDQQQKKRKHRHQLKHSVFFPSLASIQQRLLLANRLGVGVAIWELGQGLNYFFDLL